MEMSTAWEIYARGAGSGSAARGPGADVCAESISLAIASMHANAIAIETKRTLERVFIVVQSIAFSEGTDPCSPEPFN
jgi:hypothetical protein